MKLGVQGNSDALSRKELRYLVRWAEKFLLGRERIKLKVCYLPNMGENRGSCEILDEHYRPRKFKIEICTKVKQRSTLIKTILHEMVHIKQWVKGEMQDYLRPANTVRWKKRIIKDEEMSYYDLPWEKEALRMERSLYARYTKHLKKEGISFV